MREGKYTMSKQTAHEFVSSYYDVEKGTETCERKSFIRFRDAMPLGLDAEQVENAYMAFSGKSPRYNKAATSMEPWRAEDYKSKANRIVDALTHDPTSFTDLYNAAFTCTTRRLIPTRPISIVAVVPPLSLPIRSASALRLWPLRVSSGAWRLRRAASATFVFTT